MECSLVGQPSQKRADEQTRDSHGHKAGHSGSCQHEAACKDGSVEQKSTLLASEKEGVGTWETIPGVQQKHSQTGCDQECHHCGVEGDTSSEEKHQSN